MARIYRQGQEKPCFIYRLFTSGTVEEGKSLNPPECPNHTSEKLNASRSYSVICQRQIQKGNLATLTVDGGPKSKGSATSFNSEDLKECFTLKEDCDCDTKLKIGKKWPEYGKHLSSLYVFQLLACHAKN